MSREPIRLTAPSTLAMLDDDQLGAFDEHMSLSSLFVDSAYAHDVLEAIVDVMTNASTLTWMSFDGDDTTQYLPLLWGDTFVGLLLRDEAMVWFSPAHMTTTSQRAYLQLALNMIEADNITVDIVVRQPLIP